MKTNKEIFNLPEKKIKKPHSQNGVQVAPQTQEIPYFINTRKRTHNQLLSRKLVIMLNDSQAHNSVKAQWNYNLLFRIPNSHLSVNKSVT